MPNSNYALRTNGSEHGAVYTSLSLVQFMLDAAGYLSSLNLSNTKVLEPAAGDGVFLMQIIDRLHISSRKFNFSFEAALLNIKSYELDANVAQRLRATIQSYCLSKGYTVTRKVLQQVVVCEDFLLPDVPEPEQRYDIIVGNPPYIRHEQIPEKQRLSYRKLYNTFRHRSDIYIAFYEKSLRQLTDNGRLCFVCSNRWMKTKYGEGLRRLIAKMYSIDVIIDIDDRSAFDQDVDAYASVTLISNRKDAHNHFYYERIEDLGDLDPAKVAGKSGSNIFKKPKDSNWHIGEMRSFDLLDSYKGIEAQGYKIGIGVATGSDKTFINKYLPVEESLKLPIITAREIKNGEITWVGQYILNPYGQAGNLIDLEQYPLAKSYLNEHAAVLRERHTAKKSSDNSWYKTIDRIYPELTTKPKLLIPDMKRDGLFPIDEGKLYPHHNVYYITHPQVDQLKILGALLTSDFCKEQINLVSVKMRGGFARWQSQNLRRILLPDIGSFTKSVRLQLIAAYDMKDIALINKLIDKQVTRNLTSKTLQSCHTGLDPVSSQ
ncbi:MAG TPA: Eco57I restriction-modification methylase domain-containing protein [Candidatus Limnocylindria bacterium]|nr:Eco57I restriction-modification methylase domain-containing protein [Candidatus Limnocylindria bacterium]